MSDRTSQGIFGHLMWWALQREKEAISAEDLVRELLQQSRDYDFFPNDIVGSRDYPALARMGVLRMEYDAEYDEWGICLLGERGFDEATPFDEVLFYRSRPLLCENAEGEE